MSGRPDFITWATSPGGHYLQDKKKPTRAHWEPYQVEILRHLFPAGNDTLPYSSIIWSDVKKSGKTELASAVHLYFALYVDVPGEQYVMANDFEGAKARTWRYIQGSLDKNPKMKPEDWNAAGSEIRLRNGSTIKAIASDYRGEAGSNHSLATVDEPWGIIHTNSERLMTEFEPIPTRPNSTIFYTGYQGWEGVSLFWHNLIDGGRQEPVPGLEHIDDGDNKGIPACWRNGRTFVLWNHKARMPWHTPEFMEERRRAMAGRMNEYLRVWENRRVAHVEAYCTPDQWDRLLDVGVRALYAGDNRPIILAADAATKSDSTALVGTTWNDEKHRPEIVYCKIWEPEGGSPLNLTETIGAEIVRLHKEFHVEEVWYDPFNMAAISEACVREGVKMVEFPQNSRRVQSDTYLHQLIWGNNIGHYGDPALKRHIVNANAKAENRGLRIIKELGRLKVDGAVACGMSVLGAKEVLARKKGTMKMLENPFYRRP